MTRHAFFALVLRFPAVLGLATEHRPRLANGNSEAGSSQVQSAPKDSFLPTREWYGTSLHDFFSGIRVEEDGIHAAGAICQAHLATLEDFTRRGWYLLLLEHDHK